MKFTLTAKLLLSYIAIALAVIVLASFGMTQMKRIHDDGEQIYSNYLVSIVNLNKAEAALSSIALLQKAHIIAPNERVMADIERKMERTRQDFFSALQDFAKTLDIGEETEAYNKYLLTAKNLFALDNKIIILSRSNNDVEADKISEGDFIALYRKTFDLGEVMLRTNIVGASDLAHRNDQAFNQALSQGYITLVITALIFLLSILFIRSNITGALIKLTKTMQALAAKDLSVNIPFTSRRDELGEMAVATQVFKDSILQITQQNWVQLNTTELFSEIQTKHSLDDIGDSVIRRVSPLLKGAFGAFYLFDQYHNHLALSASYAYKKQDGSNQIIELGEGLVGQCGLDKKAIEMSHLPDEYTRITSGLGSKVPSHLIIYPVVLQGNLIAVIEVASFSALEEQGRNLLEAVSSVLALTLDNLKNRLDTEEQLAELDDD